MAYLVLEDGTVYEGRGFGRAGSVVGEVVFNTGMTGYQEVLTDPSYYGQIVMMTYPLIGNYGVNWEDPESMRPQVKGFVVRELCQVPSNWYSESTLNEYLDRAGIMGIEGIDTRSITRKIRDHGTMRGYICNGKPDEVLNGQMMQYSIVDSVNHVTCDETFELPGPGLRVAVMDFGLKASILKSLRKRGCHLFVHRADDLAEAVLANEPDGIMLTNGPGDPKDNPGVINELKKLAGKVPIFGICLGHQLMALACGADTERLRYGHRGTNHPVKDLEQDRVYITSQNHGYTIIEESLPKGMAVSHRNWNDMTVEGIKYLEHPTFTVQFHPEASPGPRDTAYLFDRFMNLMKENKHGAV
jgi:carbamoyl-phosphate synthase small subunit